MSDEIAITTTTSGIRFGLRVVPRASRTSIDGVRDGRLLVRVTAPPVDRAANDAVIAALADALDLPRRNLRLVSGTTGRNKVVEVAGIPEALLRSRLRL